MAKKATIKAGSVKAAVTAASVSRRGNKELQAQCLALCLHSWNNTREDWMRLEQAVTQLGAAAPARAKQALASYQRSMRVMSNPFGA
jgi:hypothetical protein